MMRSSLFLHTNNICANFRPAWDFTNTLNSCMGITAKTINRLYSSSTSKILLSTHYQTGFERQFPSTMYENLCHPVDDVFSIDAISSSSFLDGDVSNMPFKLNVTASTQALAFTKFATTLIFDNNATLWETTCDASSQTCNIANPSTVPNQTRTNETVFVEFRQSNCAWMETDQMTTMQTTPSAAQNPLRLKYFTLNVRWTNCKSDFVAALKSEYLFNVQQNSGTMSLVLSESIIIQSYSTPINPLCAIKGWHLSSLQTTDPLPDSDQLAKLFLHNSRTGPLGDLEINTTKSDHET